MTQPPAFNGQYSTGSPGQITIGTQDPSFYCSQVLSSGGSSSQASIASAGSQVVPLRGTLTLRHVWILRFLSLWTCVSRE